MMRILIINQPSFNRGDESAHKALVRSLLAQYPDAEMKVLSLPEKIESMRQYSIGDKRVDYISDPRDYLLSDRVIRAGMLYGIRALWFFHPIFWEYRKIYKWADVVICAPGGICMGGFQNWYHLFHLVLTKMFRKPLAYFGRSFGPFPTKTKDNRAFKKISLEMLKYFGYLSIRDHRTELLADELGFQYVSTVDTAFLDKPEVHLPYEIAKVLKGKQYVVFVPNYLIWHYQFKGKLSHNDLVSFYSSMIDVIFKHDPTINIVMLPQLFCGSTYAMNDIEFFREIAEKKNDSRIVVLPDCYSSDIQQTIIHDSKCVIGARYHSIVFAINQGVPFISLSYEHKMIGLLETIGMTDYCIEITESLLNGKCSEIITQVDDILTKGFVTVDTVKNKAKSIADNGIQELFKFISNSKS